MHTVSRKALIVGAVVFALGVVGFTPVVNAKSEQGIAKSHKAVHVPQAHKRTIPGKVVSFNGTTLVMTKGSATYTVTTTATTLFVDRNWKAVGKNTIVAGHKVTVKGMVTGLAVDAMWVRDVNLPMKTITPEPATETAD